MFGAERESDEWIEIPKFIQQLFAIYYSKGGAGFTWQREGETICSTVHSLKIRQHRECS